MSRLAGALGPCQSQIIFYQEQGLPKPGPLSCALVIRVRKDATLTALGPSPLHSRFLLRWAKGFFSALAPRQLEKGYANNIFTSFSYVFVFLKGQGTWWSDLLHSQSPASFLAPGRE